MSKTEVKTCELVEELKEREGDENILKSILRLFDLANRVDKYSENTNVLINDSYRKQIKIGKGTINISVEYENVPSKDYAKSLNLINDCFSDFYEEFSEKVFSQ